MRFWFPWVVSLCLVLAGAQAQTSQVMLKDFWARPAGKAIPSAAYGVIVNTGTRADTLLEAATAQAGRTELHETVRDATGRMQMRKIERIVIPARDSVVLRPGGLHVMLYDLQQALRPGDTLRLRLRFAQAGWQQVDCRVGRPPRPAKQRELPHEHRH
ncbi:MAG: copper chaperone PCu(A)C [Chlorobiota bacterium]